MSGNEPRADDFVRTFVLDVVVDSNFCPSKSRSCSIIGDREAGESHDHCLLLFWREFANPGYGEPRHEQQGENLLESPAQGSVPLRHGFSGPLAWT